MCRREWMFIAAGKHIQPPPEKLGIISITIIIISITNILIICLTIITKKAMIRKPRITKTIISKKLDPQHPNFLGGSQALKNASFKIIEKNYKW